MKSLNVGDFVRLNVLLLLSVDQARAVFTRSGSHRCFSCMSTIYKTLWSHLGGYYMAPENFTDYCNEPFLPRSDIGSRHCRTICLTLSHDIVVLGKVAARGFIRGCADGINRFGFYNKTMVLFDQYDLCREVQAGDLFRYYVSHAQSVRVCSCLGDLCNSAARTFTASFWLVSLWFVQVWAMGAAF